MNIMKIPFGLLLVSLSALAQPKHVTIGIAAEPYLPFTAYDANGEWYGYEIDVLKQVCQTAQLDCELKPIAWDGLIPSLLTGKVDVIMGAISITPERLTQFNFTQPYLKENAVIITHKSNKTQLVLQPDPKIPGQTIINESSFEGQTIGVQSGSTSYRYAQHHFPNTRTKYYDAADNSLADLRFARIDFLIGTKFYLQQFLQSPQGQDYEVRAILDDEDLLGKGIGMAMMETHSALLAEFNQALNQLEANNRLTEIQIKWFSKHQ